MAAEDATVSLLERARALNGRPGPRCRISTLQDHPQYPQIAELLAATGTEIQYSTAHEVLKSAGVELSADTISRHVRGRCSCRS